LRRQYGVGAKLKKPKGIGYVIRFEVQGSRFWVKLFNRKYKIELAHIPQRFLELRGSKLIVSASSFTRRAFNLLNRYGVRSSLVDWKLYLTQWPRHDAKSQARATLANFITWHREHSSCRKATRQEVHSVPEHIIKGGAFYCSMCSTFFEPEKLKCFPLALTPRIAYGLPFYERRLETAWFKARGKKRKWSPDLYLRSKIASLQDPDTRPHREPSLDLGLKRSSVPQGSTSPSVLSNGSETVSLFGFASDPPL